MQSLSKGNKTRTLQRTFASKVGLMLFSARKGWTKILLYTTAVALARNGQKSVLRSTADDDESQPLSFEGPCITDC